MGINFWGRICLRFFKNVYEPKTFTLWKLAIVLKWFGNGKDAKRKIKVQKIISF